jgi:hypothetical protein
MDMETRVKALEEWKNEAHPKLEQLFKAIKTNTDATVTLTKMLDAGSMLGGMLKWLAGMSIAAGTIWVAFFKK